MCVRILNFSLKARETGALSQLPEDISQRGLYFAYDSKGNTTASLHPGYPYVSALEGSHWKNIWLVCVLPYVVFSMRTL